MKKNAKKKHPVHHKKRKVSGKAEIQEFALRVVGVGAGALTGAFLIQAGNTALSSQKLPAWVIPSGVAAAGAVIPLIAKKNPLAEDFGMGMLAIGAAFAVNETFLSVPGIAGLAMSSNTPNAPGLKSSVGCTNGGMKVAGPGAYLSRTVGARNGMTRAKRFGALVSD